MVYRQSKNQTKFRSCLALVSSGKISDSAGVWCLFNFRCQNDCGCSECLAGAAVCYSLANCEPFPHTQYFCGVMNEHEFRRVRILVDHI